MILNHIKNWNLLPVLILILAITGIITPAQAADHTAEATGLTHVDHFLLTASTKIVAAAKDHPRATAAIGIAGLLAVCYAGYRYYKKATTVAPVPVPIKRTTPGLPELLLENNSTVRHSRQQQSVSATTLLHTAKEQCDINSRLLEACKNNKSEDVKRLIRVQTIDINIQDRYGMTPLMTAATWGHTEIVQLLIAAGADLNQKNQAGSTALQLATIHTNKEIILLLQQAQAAQTEKLRHIDHTSLRLSPSGL